MNEETQVVNQSEANTASDQEQAEQVQEQVESDISTTDGKDYKAIAEQLSRDIKEKNRRIQELKGQTQQQPTQMSQPEISEDETVRIFQETVATTKINNKILTDPSFKDRADIVLSYVKQGYDVDTADRFAKADIMDKILNGSQTETQETPVIKQITPNAIPEQQVAQRTGNVLDDIEKGLVDVEPEVAAMLAKYRNKG